LATVGQALTTPESGWKRIDDVDSHITYSGTILQKSYGSNNQYDWNNTYSELYPNATASFSFYGTKLRIIGDSNTSFSNGIFSVSIDGVITSNIDAGTTSLGLIFNQENLTLKTHNVIITCTSSYTTLDAIDIDENGYMTAQLGSQLLEPEPGWRRFDNKDPNITYTGSFPLITDGGSPWCGDMLYSNNSIDNKVAFNFTGSKLRIISIVMPGWYSGGSGITIDKVNYSASWNTTAQREQVIVFEKTDLSDTEHFVTLGGVNSYWGIDAVDIDSNGILKQYTEKLRRLTFLTYDNKLYGMK
jgi:hypothetical protein